MRRATVTFGVAALAAGPWLGLGPPGTPAGPVRAFAQTSPSTSEPSPPVQTPLARKARELSRCTCRDVVVDATNEVRDADITTGDATVKNRSLTYIGPGFDKKRVKVRQRARAETGDAIAGQILGVVAPDDCTNLLIRAHNLVEDSKVSSGDALAQNESVVLYAPEAGRGDIKIKVRQKARARSGNAVAGQIIGAVGGGGDCGGVTVEATNDVRHTEISTGEAAARNLSDILACPTRECRELLLQYLSSVDTVQVCLEGGCEDLTPKEFIRFLGLGSGSDPTPAPEAGGEVTPAPADCLPDESSGPHEDQSETSEEHALDEPEESAAEVPVCPSPTPGEQGAAQATPSETPTATPESSSS